MPLTLKGFNAWISSEDSELKPYSVEESDDGKEVTCWIVSEAGKRFCVNWTRPPKYTYKTRTLAGRVYINGCNLDTVCMQPKLHGKNAEEIFNSSGSRISSATERPYTFVGLQVTDDDAFLDTCNTVELGDITLKIVRTTKSRKKVPQLHDFSPRLLEEKIVHERMKKATPHSVKLGDEVTPARSCLLKNLLSFREQIVKFTFKYRPIDFLRAEGKVISDTQSQLPAASPGPDKAETSSNSMKPDVISPTIKKEDPNERHDEALNTTKIKTLEEEILQKKEELQTLRKKEDKAAKIRALRAQLAELERDDEPIESEEPPIKRVKRDDTARLLEMSREVIDLT